MSSPTISAAKAWSRPCDRRHAYGSTDLIILDYRIEDPSTGAHLMGDIFSTRTVPRIVAKVIGTGPIQRWR